MYYTYEVRDGKYDKELDDVVYPIVSDKKYTRKEFDLMCEEAVRAEENKAYTIVKYLKKNYGFEDVPIECFYETIKNGIRLDDY